MKKQFRLEHKKIKKLVDKKFNKLERKVALLDQKVAKLDQKISFIGSWPKHTIRKLMFMNFKILRGTHGGMGFFLLKGIRKHG